MSEIAPDKVAVAYAPVWGSVRERWAADAVSILESGLQIVPFHQEAQQAGFLYGAEVL